MSARCKNGHEIRMPDVVGRNIPVLRCWQCEFIPPEQEVTMTRHDDTAEARGQYDDYVLHFDRELDDREPLSYDEWLRIYGWEVEAR